MANEKAFIKYDEKTGLVVRTPGEILQDLIGITKQSYGDSYTVEQGSEMYAFLDALSQSLAETGGAMKALYDAFSFATATGNPLDTLCSLAGISRQEGETDTQLRARYFVGLYNKAVSSVEGLKAKLYDYTVTVGDNEINPVIDCIILNNTSAANATLSGVAVPAHGIAVILRFNKNLLDNTLSAFNQDLTEVIIKLTQYLNTTILDYKSLGASVATQSNYNYIFANPKVIKVEIKITLPTSFDDSQKNAIKNTITQNISDYINGLTLNNDILYSGIMSCIFDMYRQLGYTEDILNISSVKIGDTELSGTSAFAVNANEYPVLEKVEFTETE